MNKKNGRRKTTQKGIKGTNSMRGKWGHPTPLASTRLLCF